MSHPPARRRTGVAQETNAVVVLSQHGEEVARWPLASLRRPDLAAIDDLARVRLAARRLGCSIVVLDACAELRALLDLVGLDAVVSCDDRVRDPHEPR
jgi:ABC-type transporter Mla MlaB component